MLRSLPLALRLLEDPSSWAKPDTAETAEDQTSAAAAGGEAGRDQHGEDAVRRALFTGVGEGAHEPSEAVDDGVGAQPAEAPLAVLDEEELKPQAAASSPSRPVVGSLGFFSDTFLQATRQAYHDFKAHSPDRFSMTQSQEVLFESVLRNRLQMVWGPPGTGKTQFLALLVLCLLEAHRRVVSHGVLNVVVTAYTHVAIENLLIRVAELQHLVASSVPGYEAFELYKLGDA